MKKGPLIPQKDLDVLSDLIQGRKPMSNYALRSLMQTEMERRQKLKAALEIVLIMAERSGMAGKQRTFQDALDLVAEYVKEMQP